MFNYRATVALLGIIASSRSSVTKLEAAKLVYIMDKRHLEHFGRTITGDHYFAMPNGPVPSTTLNLINADEATDSKRYAALRSDMDELAIDAREVVAYRDSFLNIERKGNTATITAKKAPNLEELSESDEKIAKSVLAEFKDSGVGDILAYVHGLPEFERRFDESKKRVPIPIRDMLKNGSKRAKALYAFSR